MKKAQWGHKKKTAIRHGPRHNSTRSLCRRFNLILVGLIFTLLAMLGQRSINTSGVVEYSNEPPVQITASGEKRKLGYTVSMFAGTRYLCGAIMLAWTLRDRDPDHDLVAVISGELESPENHKFAKEVLQKAGYRVYETPLLKNPLSKNNYYQYHYSKLNVFGIDDYERLVFIDVDFFLLHGEPKEILDKYSGHPKPAVFSNDCKGDLCLSTCKGKECRNPADWPINSGFMVFHPSSTLLNEMKAQFNKIESYDEGDQGFIDVFFKQMHQGFDFIDDPEKVYENNWEKRGPVPKDWKAIHIFGVKPWLCPKGLHCACHSGERENAMWPQVNNLWWEYYEEMVAAWPWLLQDDRHKKLCLTENTECVKSLKVKHQSFSKKNKIAFLHIPMTGGNTIDKTAAQGGYRWGVCNYWYIDGICNKNDLPPVKLTNPFRQQWFHVPIQWIPDEVPTYYDDSNLFAVVRNPYDRIVSEFFFQCHEMPEGCGYKERVKLNSAAFMNAWIQTQLKKVENCPREEKLDPVYPDKNCIMMFSGHFILQSDFIYDLKPDGQAVAMVDYVLHTETLDEEFASLMDEYNYDLKLPAKKLERTSHSLSTTDLDKESIELINRIYKRDFDEWGYKMM